MAEIKDGDAPSNVTTYNFKIAKLLMVPLLLQLCLFLYEAMHVGYASSEVIYMKPLVEYICGFHS